MKITLFQFLIIKLICEESGDDSLTSHEKLQLKQWLVNVNLKEETAAPAMKLGLELKNVIYKKKT
ncbi:MAG: hypothetical protein ABRQ27_13435 [Clostridiaceae bacterium]